MNNAALINSMKNKFYFGIGGIGDLLLLMSTFYDDVKWPKDKIDVLFIANNVTPVKEIAKAFPNITNFVVYPRGAFDVSVENWNLLFNNPKCLGTGVTPKNFHYISEWVKVGQESSVFDEYLVVKNPKWADGGKSNLTVIQPYGGADDKTKIKEIPDGELVKLIKKTKIPFVIIGSKSDIERVKRLNLVGYVNTVYVTDLLVSFNMIKSCSTFYGADSWGKTLAIMSGARTIVYPNRYLVSPQEMFGHGKDPGDYIFLDGWGFEYAKIS